LAAMIALEIPTWLYIPSLAANLPTPGLGIMERANAGLFLLWIVVLAVTLLRRHDVNSASAS
jgi:hypothetical protein